MQKKLRLNLEIPDFNKERGVHYIPSTDEVANKMATKFFEATAKEFRQQKKNPELKVFMTITTEGSDIVAIVESWDR